MKRIILFLILSLLLASPAMAGTKNGKKLLDECSYVVTTVINTSEKLFMHDKCLTYIQAVNDAHNTFVKYKEFGAYYCLPYGTTYDQLGKIIYKYLNEHPEKIKQTASSSVLDALKESFPCNESKLLQ